MRAARPFGGAVADRGASRLGTAPQRRRLPAGNAASPSGVGPRGRGGLLDVGFSGFESARALPLTTERRRSRVPASQGEVRDAASRTIPMGGGSGRAGGRRMRMRRLVRRQSIFRPEPRGGRGSVHRDFLPPVGGARRALRGPTRGPRREAPYHWSLADGDRLPAGLSLDPRDVRTAWTGQLWSSTTGAWPCSSHASPPPLGRRAAGKRRRVPGRRPCLLVPQGLRGLLPLLRPGLRGEP
jgi:hypothetical protein